MKYKNTKVDHHLDEFCSGLSHNHLKKIKKQTEKKTWENGLGLNFSKIFSCEKENDYEPPMKIKFFFYHCKHQTHGKLEWNTGHRN